MAARGYRRPPARTLGDVSGPRSVLVSLALAAVVGLTIGAVARTAASADGTFYGYVRSDPRGADRDPINLLYDAVGQNAVLAAFAADLGWPDNGGSRMLFLYRGSQHSQDAQRASACGGCDRYHIRFRTAAARPDLTIAATHYEVVSWCGHSSRSFDHARDRVAAAMAAQGGTVTWQYWGNVEMSVQCDGYEVSSDGWIARVSVR